MSRKTHPDRGGDDNTFKKVNEAYEVLGQGCKRKLYDEGKYDELVRKMEEESNEGREGKKVGGQRREGGAKRTRRKKRHRKKRKTSKTTRKRR